MFSIESLEFETIMNRHLIDYQTAAGTVQTINANADLFLCNDNSSDSDLYSSYNSDQENNIDKMWVLVILYYLLPLLSFLLLC